MKFIVETEAAWLELRKQYITASSAAVLVGADPYSSPAKLKKPDVFTGNAYTLVGQMLEPVVCNVTNSVLGLTGDAVFNLIENAAGHKEFYTAGLLGATPDAYSEGLKMLLECKTTRPQTFLKYSSVPPAKYLIQLIVQMLCTDISSGYLAIMSTNLTQASPTLIWPISIYKVYRCERICNILLEQVKAFTENDNFRVDSKIKQKVKLLLSLCYERVKI